MTDSLDPFAPMFVGALTALVIRTFGWIFSKWVHRMMVKFSVKRNLDEALGRFAAMQHNVRMAIYDALDEAGIEVPFDQIVVHQA